MNFQQLDKFRRELSCTFSRLAKLLRVTLEEIKSWKSAASIPDKYIDYISGLHKTIEFTVQSSFKKIGEMDPGANEIILIKYSSDSDLSYADPEAFKLFPFHELYTYVLSKVSQICKENGKPVKAISFRREKYKKWLIERFFCNCPMHRAKWVSTENNYSVSFEQILFMENLLKESLKNIRKIKNLIIKRFNFDHSIGLKIQIMQNILLQSILDLAEESISCYKKEKLIPAASMVRALFEREALLYYLFYSARDCVQNNIIEDERLKKIFFGARGGRAEIESINIITVIEKQVKNELQDWKVMELYGELFNLVHPNFNGVWDAYFNMDIKSLNVVLDSRDKGNIGLTVLANLAKGLGLAVHWYKNLIEVILEYQKLESLLRAKRAV